MTWGGCESDDAIRETRGIGGCPFATWLPLALFFSLRYEEFFEELGENIDKSPLLEQSILVGVDSKPQRLDSFLSDRFEDRSRSHLKRLIQEGYIQVNGRSTKPGYEVRPGDQVSIVIPAPDPEVELVPTQMPMEILYEDDDVVVVNKAPGVVVHPGAGHRECTLVHGLLAHCTRLAAQGAPQRPGIVHRLDQGTSGALVVAKSDVAYLDLIDQFKEHRVRKEYLAMVYGRFAQPAGEVRTLMDRHPQDRKKMAVVPNRGREAISTWRVEKEWQEITLLRVAIETGRTHQIRVHLSHLQHPVVGDATYGGGRRKARSVGSNDLRQLLLQVDRQMLHAWRLAFRHPRTRDPLSFVAPLPLDFQQLIGNLERLLPTHKA